MITTIIIAACVIFSLLAFNSPVLFNKYLFNAYATWHSRQYYRIFTHAFLHVNYMHLAFNMYALYLFGSMIENVAFPMLFGIKGEYYYVLLYLGGIIFSVLPDLGRYRDNPNYSSVGASGAVNAVVFSSILINPNMGMGILFIPFFIPAWLFGVLYMAYSWYMDKRGGSNIGHSAHLWGGLFGLVFTLLLKPELVSSFFSRIF